MAVQTFEELLSKKHGEGKPLPKRLLALDPGHTTGWSLWEEGKMTTCGQLDWVVDRKGQNEGRVDYHAIIAFFNDIQPDCVIYEDYRVYAHKLERHTHSQVLTLRIIGAIETLATMGNVPAFKQMAATAKGFCTDPLLKRWGFWEKAQRHSRDSIRHGAYFLLFSKEVAQGMLLNKWRRC